MPFQKKRAASKPKDQDFLVALQKIDKALTDYQAARKRAFPDKEKICQTYNKIKVWLQMILPLIDKIPVFGKKIADAIRFLMGIADSYCGY